MHRPRNGILALVGSLAFAAAAAAQTWRSPTDSQVQDLLRQYVDEQRLAPGVVVGIWQRDAPSGQHTRFFAQGRSGGRGVPLDEHTLFELGSITKGFTGLLLADWTLRTGRPLETPVAEVWRGPAEPLDAWAEITLLDLATHHSGLPRLPTQPSRLLPMLFSRDPYAGTEPADVLTAAASLASRRSPGDFAYSNLGYAVLGQILAARAERPYPEMLRERVLEPLGLDEAWLSPAAAPADRLAQGFGRNLRPVPHWHLDGYAPAGGLISDARSLLDFLRQMAMAPSPAWTVATTAYHELNGAKGAIGLGWMRRPGANGTLIWHNGGTGGFRTFCGVVPEAGLAVVVLTNGLGNADALALALVESGRPPPTARARPWFGYLVAGFGVILAPAMAWLSALPVARRPGKQRPLDRTDLLSLFTGAAFLLTVSARHGAWQWLPFAMWWGGLWLTLAAVLPAARTWPERQWLTGAPWWRALRLAQFAFFALILLVLIR